jgi:predicted secreted Zn-dependent protease
MKPYIETASAAGLEWVKSSYSGNNGNCVEVAVLPAGARALRDSKNPHGPALVFSAEEWGVFVAGVEAGEFKLA